MNKDILVKLFCMIIIFGCNNHVNIEKLKVEEWEELSLKNIKDCCSEFNNSLVGLVLNRSFNNNVRYKALNYISPSLKGERFQIFENYSNSNEKSFNIIDSSENLISLIYDEEKDSIYQITNSNFNIKEFKERLEELKSAKIDCCNLQASHPSITLYSSIRLGGNEIDVLETYSW